MIDRDRTGLAAATIALGLAAGAWLAESWAGAEPPIDHAAVARASLVALENHGAGQPLVWRDRATGTSATITPASAWQAGDALWCRTYVVAVADRPSTRHVACRDDLGRWSGLERSDQQMAAN